MSAVIKIYLIGNFRYTPFGGFHPMDLEYLLKNNIIITDDIDEAEVLVSQNRKHLVKYFYKFLKKKKYLIWTNEPRFNTHMSSVKKEALGFVNCHVMNLYTEDVFVSPLSFHGHLFQKNIKSVNNDFELGSRKVVGLISYFRGLNTPSVIKNNRDIDLIKVRTKIALAGHKQGVFDIYGRGWPNNVSIEDSRTGNWVDRKAEILEPYAFNLCFENTATRNYITEKIWDSIKHYCLPIYFGKNTGIYELFPKNSFIDYSIFNSPEELFSFIDRLSIKEYIDRMNSCIKVYQSIQSKGESFVHGEREKALQAIINKLKKMVE